MRACALGRKVGYSGLRPLEPARDLGQVVALLEGAFGEEVGREGRQALKELRFWARLSPLIWLLDRFEGAGSHFLEGFVWVEGGRVVGNVNISEVDWGRWVISNLVVASPYRRRGIGRRLMEAAIDLACQQGGEMVILRVRADNEVALNLYHSLGFEEVSATTEMRLTPRRLSTLASHLPSLPTEGFTLRPIHRDEWEKEYELALTTTSIKAQQLEPPQKSDFRIGLSQMLKDLLAGRREYRLAVEREGEFVATLTVRATRFLGEHSLRMMVHPNHRGRLEEMLITRALSILAKYPRRSVTIKHPADHQEAIQALRKHGFHEERTLVKMKLELELLHN